MSRRSKKIKELQRKANFFEYAFEVARKELERLRK
jgi:hypothetical protein